MHEVGTLKELNVKPGDLVEHITDKELGKIDEFMVWRSLNGHSNQPVYLSLFKNWRIVTKASDVPPKLWRDMTDAEKGALLLAEYKELVIEVYDSGKWVKRSFPVWGQGNAYRIRPEPVKEVVKTHGTWSSKGQMPKSYYAYEIEFETVDGQPQWSTAKVVGR